VQGFEPLPAQIDLPALEREVLARWQAAGVFERSLKQTEGGAAWIFYEGPPTANGMPGVHHVEARTFKDLFPRFKTMQGFHVPRKGGWDCHGLPVEVAVEKELGFSGKRDIEAYGVAEFNARCRESVLRHVDAWLEMSRRMGYWADTEHAYRTMDASYVESVWWSLKVVYDAGLLVRDFRISPYCPRCGTPLSDAELGQPDVYRVVRDPAITVRFRLRALPEGAPAALEGADLLIWTTTPWTLVANTAVAIHPEATYVLARRSRDGDRVVVADDLFAKVLGDGWHVAARFSGKTLVGASYQRPFGLIQIPNAHVVVPGSFVTTEDGTGLVHLAPAFGADDMATSRAHGLPVVNPIRPDGRFEDDVPLVGGMFFKDADRRLPALLALRHLAAVLRAALLVHQDHRDQGPAARAERADELVPGDGQARALRRVAAQQRGLGAVPDPVLGHAAAAVGVRAVARDLCRLAGRAVGAGRRGPDRTRSAPPVRRRDHVHLPFLRRGRRRGRGRGRRAGATGARGD
jgi:isoleucyl-tRNA synthetase